MFSGVPLPILEFMREGKVFVTVENSIRQNFVRLFP